MDENEIQNIISGDIQSLHSFVSNHNQTFTFPEIRNDNKRNDLWNCLFNNLEHTSTSSSHIISLTAIRLLSRDKALLNELITEPQLELLVNHAGLQISENCVEIYNVNYDVVLECLKCLCNIIYNSPFAQKVFSKNNAIYGIVNRLRMYRDGEVPQLVKFFDMNLLFLITAFSPETRAYLKDELHGLTYLTESLDLILREAAEQNENATECAMEDQVLLTDHQVDLACEILKVLFNLSVRNSDFPFDEEEESYYTRLVSVLHDLLLTLTHSSEKRTVLHGHVINLLTAVPGRCFNQLVIRNSPGQDINKDLEYDGYNMEAIFIILMFLKGRLEGQPSPSGQHELLSPILTVLTRSSRNERIIRKYLRMQVLPPLKEVHKRPEQGETLRNYLCRLLTTPITHVRDLAADFLFVLCKENVDRMIKYTGYGNAAGLFATRGLMGGKTTDESRFSSESEDSDTEIYKEYRHGINPVVGCYEPPKPDPLAHMSEEQKEYEAMQLVNLMDRLTRSGMIQPCRVGEDGRPEPVEHVLQLQEELPRQQINRNNSNN